MLWFWKRRESAINRTIVNSREADPPMIQKRKNKSLQTSEVVLIKIPIAEVHLVDAPQVVLLDSGEFSLIKLVQNGHPVAVFAKVGENVQWPILRDAQTSRIDGSHYVFSFPLASATNGRREKSSLADAKYSKDDLSKPCSVNQGNKQVEMLNYGVTFGVEGNEAALIELDRLLQIYSFFSPPLKAKDKANAKQPEIVPETSMNAFEGVSAKKSPQPVSAQLSGKDTPSAYWQAVAPNIQEYNSYLAKMIATGSDHLVKGILLLGGTAVLELDEIGAFTKGCFGQTWTPPKINPKAVKLIRRAELISAMCAELAESILSGVVLMTGTLATPIIRTELAHKLFRMVPAEVALASLDAFGKVFDALELVGKSVISKTSIVTSEIVSHRLGEDAGTVTRDGLAIAGHIISTAWDISMIAKAVNPRSVAKSAFLWRTAAKVAGGKTN